MAGTRSSISETFASVLGVLDGDPDASQYMREREDGTDVVVHDENRAPGQHSVAAGR